MHAGRAADAIRVAPLSDLSKLAITQSPPSEGDRRHEGVRILDVL
jgi:hypothetical protein